MASSSAQKQTSVRKKHLAELIGLVTDIAEGKGWVATVASQDQKTFKYASVSVWRQAPDTQQEITATFDITCDEIVRVSPQQTSFYSWGLKDLASTVAEKFEKLTWIQRETPTAVQSPESTTAIDLVERLLRRFHRVVRQLKHRYSDRPPITIQDEYDVQDLLHALLRGLFDDVRPEEYAPSYAGSASRMDFLLKAEQIVLETKVTSASLRDRQVGEQLIIDIKRYSAHPDCKHLVCFVYDPGGLIKNPIGLERDLSGSHEKVKVKVVVWSA